MHDSKDFKDADSLHSGQLSHVPSDSALISSPRWARRFFLAAPKLCCLIFGTRRLHRREPFFTSPPAYPSSSHERMLPPWDQPDAGRISERTCTKQPVTEDGDGGKSAIPNPRFLRSSSTGNSFDPMKGRFFRIMGLANKDFKFGNLILTGSQHQKRFRVGE